MMDHEQDTTTASIVRFVDVQVIHDGGPKVLVRLSQSNNGEPVDVAVVVMAPELANILSANWRMPPLKQTGARYYGFLRIDASIDQRRPAPAIEKHWLGIL